MNTEAMKNNLRENTIVNRNERVSVNEMSLLNVGWMTGNGQVEVMGSQYK